MTKEINENLKNSSKYWVGDIDYIHGDVRVKSH